VEVPLPTPGDRRAFDAVIGGAGETIAVEAETRFRDLQAVRRRIAAKCRDANVSRVILLVLDSRTNRAVLDAAGEAFELTPKEIELVKAGLEDGALGKPEQVVKYMLRVAEEVLPEPPRGT
jgi:hypothetical protein